MQTRQTALDAYAMESFVNRPRFAPSCPPCHGTPPSYGNSAAVSDAGLSAGGQALGDDEMGFLGFAMDTGLQHRADGATRVGTTGEAWGMRTDHPLTDACRLETAILKGSVDTSIGSDGATGGAGIEFGSAAVNCAKADPNAVDRNLLRVGVGLGEGLALRAHWSDTDGDGRREYGTGADVGPFSMDYKTEAPWWASEPSDSTSVASTTGGAL